MNKIILVLTLFSFNHFIGQKSINTFTKVEYGVLPRQKTIIDTSKIKDNTLKDYFLNIIESSDPSVVTFTLLFNDKESLFNSNFSMNLGKKIIEPNIYAINAKNIGAIYTNNLTGEIINYKESYGEKLLIEHSLSPKNWTITQETKNISGYICYKAIKPERILNSKDEIVSVNVEAWFAPKINSNFGPLWFKELPGLILELHFENYVYLAKKIEKFESKTSQVFKLKSGKKIKYIDYLTWIKDIDSSDNELKLEKN